MNTKVHQYIAEKGFILLPIAIKKEWVNGKFFMVKTCMYPDIFADRDKSKKEKKKIDPEADLYIEPLPPKAKWYKELCKKILNNPTSFLSETVPEKLIYLIFHYLKNTIMYLKKRDMERAGKFAGVFSHIIGDIAQPIHLVNSRVLDLLIKCPDEFLSFELHAGIEGISGRPIIKGYEPEILGNSLPRAVMGLYKKILLMAEECRYTTPLMVKAIYSHHPEQAVKIAGISVKLATCVFSDFLRTVWAIAYKENIPFKPFGLTDYPYIHSTVDMLYRYKPMKNISLIPYSGGKSYPLTLLDKNRQQVQVSGLGVIPYLGPLKSNLGTVQERDAKIDFFIWPESYSWFKAKVGLNPLFKKSEGKVLFRIFADTKLIAKCGPISPYTPYRDFEVKLPENIHFLTLSMLTIEEPSKPLAETHPHGVWGEPKLI